MTAPGLPAPAVPAPATVRGADPALGRLATALEWLASAQGAWPPRTPACPRRVVVDAGTAGGPTDGRELADALVDGGADLLVTGADVDQVPGLVALAALLGLEPVQAVGTAAGPDWAARTTGVRDGLRVARQHTGNPEALLAGLGSAPLAVLTGVLAQAAVRRTPVLLDGSPVTAAAAVLAAQLFPGAAAWWLAGQVPPAPAARKGLAGVGLTGLLDLALELPAGADVAALVLERAVELVPDDSGG